MLLLSWLMFCALLLLFSPATARTFRVHRRFLAQTSIVASRQNIFACRWATLCITFCGRRQKERRMQSRLDGAVFVWGRRCVTRRWYPSRRSFCGVLDGWACCIEKSHAVITFACFMLRYVFVSLRMGHQASIVSLSFELWHKAQEKLTKNLQVIAYKIKKSGVLSTLGKIFCLLHSNNTGNEKVRNIFSCCKAFLIETKSQLCENFCVCRHSTTIIYWQLSTAKPQQYWSVIPILCNPHW